MTLQKKIIAIEGRPIRTTEPYVLCVFLETVGRNSIRLQGSRSVPEPSMLRDLHKWHITLLYGYICTTYELLSIRPGFHQRRDSYIICPKHQRKVTRKYSEIEMRFLCLHGRGTNAKIFEMQTGNNISVVM